MAKWSIDALLPPLCPVTREPVAEPGVISASAFANLQFIDDPVCAVCGAPFAHEFGAGAICGACLADPPSFDSARAAVAYDDASHGLIVAFKHSDRTDLAPLFARWMIRAGATILRKDSILIPAPLHWRRLFARRFNQAAMLAEEIARSAGVRIEPMALARTRPTPPQKALSADQRRRNVAGAFALRPGAAAALKGAHIVLIDDVMTTGATLSAAARALRPAKPSRIDALVIARTARIGTAIG